MMENTALQFIPMKEEHIPLLTPIMVRAFDDDAQRYRGVAHDGPPGYDDGSFLRQWGIEAKSEAYALYHGGELVGGIILFFDLEKQEGFLGCLFIDSVQHGKGLGAAAWRQAEALHPEVKVWHTETPALSYRNHCFYVNTCGFHVVRISDPHSPEDAQFQMEKRMI